MKNIRNIILIFTWLFAITAIVYGSIAWNQQINQSGAEANQSLESQGIKVRTVDTTIFAKEDKEQGSTMVSEEQHPEVPQETEKPFEAKAKESTQKPAKSLLEIKQEYTGQFLVLEAEINELLDELLERVMADYIEIQESNGTVDVSKFQTPWVEKIIDLEKYSDSEFNIIYRKFEDEIVAHGYSKSEVTPYRSKYNTEKQNRERKAIEEFRALR